MIGLNGVGGATEQRASTTKRLLRPSFAFRNQPPLISNSLLFRDQLLPLSTFYTTRRLLSGLPICLPHQTLSLSLSLSFFSLTSAIRVP